MTLAVLDVETTRLRDGERPRTKFWGLAVDGEDYRRFDTTAELWNYLRRRREKLLLYHHHDFDPIQAITDGAPLVVRDVVHGRLLRCLGPGDHEWRNSHRLFPSPLKDILEACGFVKPELEELEERNRADTVDALEAFKRIASGFEDAFDVNPLGGRYLTAASVAFAAAQKAAGKLPRELRYRESYRGGRVEAFRVGKRDLDADQWDVGSSYPYAFLDLPARDVLFLLDVEVDRRWDGPCPFFAHGHEKLLFPRGRFTTWVWKSTYDRYLAPHGKIVRVKIVQKIACDFAWIHRLHDLISGAYALRQRVKKTNAPLAFACKIGLNSIYGRLGMAQERQVAVTSASIAAGADVPYHKLPGGRFLSFVDVKTEPQANYLFASAITDNARGRLYDALRSNEGAFYCDTDSVYVPRGQAFVGRQGAELGAWKFEGAGKLQITGLKDYVFDGHVKRKGGDEHFEWTVRKALSRGHVRQVVKRRLSTYDKREILPSGRTLPITLCEW